MLLLLLASSSMLRKGAVNAHLFPLNCKHSNDQTFVKNHWKRICSNTLNFKFMQSAFQTVLRISEPFTSLFSNPQKRTTQLQMNQYTDNAPIMLQVDHHCQ